MHIQHYYILYLKKKKSFFWCLIMKSSYISDEGIYWVDSAIHARKFSTDLSCQIHLSIFASCRSEIVYALIAKFQLTKCFILNTYETAAADLVLHLNITVKNILPVWQLKYINFCSVWDMWRKHGLNISIKFIYQRMYTLTLFERQVTIINSEQQKLFHLPWTLLNKKALCIP